MCCQWILNSQGDSRGPYSEVEGAGLAALGETGIKLVKMIIREVWIQNGQEGLKMKSIWSGQLRGQFSLRVGHDGAAYIL